MTYVPKHPSLFRYDPAHLDPALVARGDPLGIVSEGEQIFMYPGGLSHEHEGVAITAGTRYLMCSSFY